MSNKPMKAKPIISVAIATYNEEPNISKCLKALEGWVDEIIIVDGESSDKTVEIASKFANTTIVKTSNKPIFHINKQMAIQKCHGLWILQLDADEIVTDELRKEITNIASENTTKFNGFWIKRKNYFLGHFLTKGGVYPDPTIRFYRNGKGYLPCESVHEQATIEGQVGWLTSDLEHYADVSFSRYLQRNNRYTTLIGQELVDQKLKPSLLNFIKYFIFLPIHWFFIAYFRHLGLVDGFPGFVFAWFSSLRFAIAYIKFWEMHVTQRKITLSQDWN